MLILWDREFDGAEARTGHPLVIDTTITIIATPTGGGTDFQFR